MPEIEYRSTKTLRFHLPTGDEKQEKELRGYASTFNQPYEVDGVIETISPCAFNRTLGEEPDVFALVSHDPSRVIARTSNGTLSLRVDETGLAVTIKPVNTQDGRDVITLVETGTLDAMSFGFVVCDDQIEMRGGRVYRAITDLQLHEVSVVAFPANKQAKISMRSREQADKLLLPQPTVVRGSMLRMFSHPLAKFLHRSR